MIFTQDFLPDNHPTNTKKFFRNNRPETITIHWTGDQIFQSPKTVRDWFAREGNIVSAHFIVKNNEVLQCVPLPRVAYHCGDVFGNETSIGIEVIASSVQGEFSDESIQSLRELYFLLGQLPLERHYDWSEKKCPLFYIDNNRWAMLKSLITKS